MEIFTVDMDALSYSESALVNAAVERKFEIIGEALNQLSKCDTVIDTKIPGVSKNCGLWKSFDSCLCGH